MRGGPKSQLAIAEWMVGKCPHLELPFAFGADGRQFPLFSAIGVESAGRLLAGVLYEGYNGVNVDVHIAGERGWCTPGFLGETFRYPFLQLGAKRLTGKTPASNAVSRRFQEALGFTLEGVMRKALPDGDDLAVYGMLREECRWLEVGKNGIQRLIA